MTMTESHIWATVYAAVIAACGTNSNDSWERIRERAATEAYLAVDKVRSGKP